MKKLFATESLINVVIGYLLNLVLVYFMLHFIGYEIRLHENAMISLVMAVVAFLRGYFIRALFDGMNSSKEG